MKNIPISDLKAMAEKYGLSHVCVYGYCEEEKQQYVATYGVTQNGCDQIAQFGDKVKKEAGWPDSTLGELPSRVKKFKNENDSLLQENLELKQKLEQFEYKFAVDKYESESGWGKSHLGTEKFKTEKEAQDFVVQYNSKNIERSTPNYYTYADSPRRINSEA